MVARREHEEAAMDEKEQATGTPDPHVPPNPTLGGSFENNSQVRRPDAKGARPGLVKGADADDPRQSTLGNSNATTVNGKVIHPE